MFEIERVRASWQRETEMIDAVVLSMSEEAARQPVRDDGWSTQDLLGHIANSARVFVDFIRSPTPPLGEGVDVHSLNDQQRQRNLARPWADVQAYWQQVRDDVAAFLKASTTELGEQPAQLPWMPNTQTASDVLRLLILHTRSHREELVRGTAAPVEE
jgi:uncharacterized protein (TIGR03083 family)